MKKLDVNTIKKYAESHTIMEACKEFCVCHPTMRKFSKRNGIVFASASKYRDVINALKGEPNVLPIDELYEKYGSGLSENAFYYILHNHNIPYGKSKNRRLKEEHPYNYINLDLEHLKANASKYTCQGYYDTFKPPCARTTLRNRAIELGIEWSKPHQEPRNAYSEKEISVIKEYYPTMGVDCIKFLPGRSKHSIRRWASRNGVKYDYSKKQYANTYSEEEVKIIEKYYPIMGADCVKFLPGRSKHSIRSWSSRNGIKYDYSNRRVSSKYATEDHLGNQYCSKKEMAKAYGIPYDVLYLRMSRYGWSLEKALETPVGFRHIKRIPKVSRSRAIKQQNSIGSRIGKNIKRLRKEKGYTRTDFASKLKLSDVSSVELMENGMMDLTMDMVSKIAGALGCSVDDIVK